MVGVEVGSPTGAAPCFVVGGTLCNFCPTHRSLHLSGGAGAAGGSHCIKRTLAQVAALRDHQLDGARVANLLSSAGGSKGAQKMPEMTRRGCPSRLTTRIHG